MMEKITVRIADIPFGMECRYSVMPKISKAYLSSEEPLFWISASDEDIAYEMENAPDPLTPEWAEVSALHRKFLEIALSHDAFFLHSAFIEYEGVGYAFAAKSGVGKSTHIRLWQSVFGEKVRIINGDKPIIRYIDSKFYAYGAPWCGKERYSINDRCELKKLCFIERAQENAIRRIDTKEALVRITPQLMIFSNGKKNLHMLDLIDRLFQSLEFYVLGCTPTEEAAKVAYGGMNQKKGI